MIGLCKDGFRQGPHWTIWKKTLNERNPYRTIRKIFFWKKALRKIWDRNEEDKEMKKDSVAHPAKENINVTNKKSVRWGECIFWRNVVNAKGVLL